MANFTPDFYSNTQPSFGEDFDAKINEEMPKRSTIDFILSYSKSIEFVKRNVGKRNVIAEVNLN